MKKFLLIFILSFLGVMLMQAQRTVTGTVVSSDDNLGVPSATVIVKGSVPLIGTATDFDGHYSLNVPEGAILVFSYTGMQNQEVEVGSQSVIDVTLISSATGLGAVVVIGYGTMTKEKLTGSVSTVGQESLNKGLATSPMQLIAGKVAGVNITPSTGRAGDGNRIRIRGGASLNANNDPLIVIDGLPMSYDGIAGQTNALSSLNPNDIESYTILKDASATAIYGSRASNGVIIITTKKGSGKKLNIEFTTTNSIATVARRIDVLGGDELKKLVENYDGFVKADGTPNLEEKARYLGYLGYTENGVKKYANTDWQKEIFRPAFSSDNNLTISGKVPHLPYRVSVGYLNQDGLLKTDNMQRVTGAVQLNPTFFKGDLLHIDINLKGSWAKSRFGNSDAIGSALRMDPTKPVTAEGMEAYNGYWQWSGSGTTNPVSQLYSKHDIGTAGRAFGNVQVDYKMHFCPDLRANINVGFDYSNGKGYNAIEGWSKDVLQDGTYSKYNQTRLDLLLEAYLAYSKDFGKNHFDIMGGYTYQSWLTKGPNFPSWNYDQSVITPNSEPTFANYKDEHVLISFYGRANYSWADKYLLQASIRTDGTSRCAPENRWGWFPAASAAWIISKENFLKNNKAVSNLKLRLGWGMTGQQEVGNYEYLSRYNMSTNTAMVQFGDTYYYMWRPEGYDPERRWESTTTYNAGLDYGFLKGKIYGAIDLYYKHTTNLLNKISIPLGSNFTNEIIKNIGSMDNKGIELSFNYVPVNNKDWTVDLGLNVTLNSTKITKLTLNDGDSNYMGSVAGRISGATGNFIQISTVGYDPFSFYVYEQNYDADGKPIEGSFVDRNNDGTINESDRYRYKSPEPVAFIGFNANVTWKNLTLSTSLRSCIGNYIYNNVNSDNAKYQQMLNSLNFIQNSTTDIHNSGFKNSTVMQMMSDYYVQNASFLKMDYISLAYDFGQLVKPCRLSVNLTVQNVFVLTGYKGVDPEIAGGLDNNVYPYPRTFSLGIKLQY